MSSEPTIGDILLDRYELVEELGRGGFGIVYRAKQLGMNRDVAVKLLHADSDDEEMRERFRREAMMARNLNHPHTIRQYDFGETEHGTLYLVLEYLDGVNLVEAIRREGALGDARVREIAEGVLKSLGEAHAQGIVHRDMKPANIMICNIFGEKDFPKVLDFGIAKAMHGNSDLTQVGVALGSPRYMAPELLQGLQPTPAADVYSVAITFAEAIIGRPLLDPTITSIEAAQLQLSPNPLPIPAALRESSLYPWLSIALKKNPEQRYESAVEMLDHLHVPNDRLAALGAVIPSSPAVDDDAVPTGRFESAPDIDPHGETIVGGVDQMTDPSMTTLPADGIPAHVEDGADQFAKTEALEAVEGPDEAVQGPDATVESIQISAYEDGEAPTEMISLDDFHREMDAASKEMALAPTAESNPAVEADLPPSSAKTEVNVAIRADSPAEPSVESSSPSSGFGMLPGIGQNASTAPQAADTAAADGERTEFISIDSMRPPQPHVSPEEKKTQRTLIIALVGIVLLALAALGGLAVFLVSMSDTREADAEVTERSGTVAPSAPVEKVDVKIFTTPKITAIIIDGQEKAKTPAHFKIAKKDLPKEIELRHPGYEPATIEVTAGGKNVFDVKLESAVGNASPESPDDAKAEPEESVDEPEEKAPAPPREKKRRKRKKKPADDNVVPLFD